MRIGIDLCSLRRKTTGIEYYAFHLAKALSQTDEENEYVLFFPRGMNPQILGMNPKLEARVCPSNNQLWCEQIWLPSVGRAASLDLFHFPAFPPSPLHRGRMVLTVHDASIWGFPETASWKGLYYFKGLYRMSIGRSKRVITHSGSSRDEIVRFARIEREKIAVVYPAASNVFQPIQETDQLVLAGRRLGLLSPFILTVGTLEPRKNHMTLIDAYEILRQRYGFRHRLVIVGRNAWGYKQVVARINRSSFKSDILLVGFVSTSDLVAIYNLAQVFVYPSIYEGFGLPPLEAMSCGCPVVVSSRSSLPEVVSDAGVLIDPCDAQGMAEAIGQVLEDSSLRENMVVRGLDRAKTFTWRKAALAALRVYEEAVAG